MDLGKGETFRKLATKIIKKYSKAFVTDCPQCKTRVNTLIFSNGRVMCPYCEKKNILDAFSLLSKMPEGKEKVHAIFGITADKKHAENIMEIEDAVYKDKKIEKFGSIKMQVSDKLLQKKEDFIRDFIVMIVAVDKKLYNSVFGVTIKKEKAASKEIQ